MDFIETSGKTVEEAIEEALRTLGTTEDMVEIEILEAGTKGILGFGAKPARVVVTMKADPVYLAKKFLNEVGKAMGMEIALETELKDKQLQIDMSGTHMGVLIGKRGQTLDSLQYLTNLVVNKGDASYVAVTLDAENYRQRRKETLESLAINIAKKVKQTKRSVKLEPMSPYERRIIHSVLQNDKYVSTYSEGEDPCRNVVIALQRGRDRDREKTNSYDA